MALTATPKLSPRDQAKLPLEEDYLHDCGFGWVFTDDGKFLSYQLIDEPQTWLDLEREEQEGEWTAWLATSDRIIQIPRPVETRGHLWRLVFALCEADLRPNS